MDKRLTAPFPYFGTKRHIATDVWKRLGNTKQYIEPFCGSAAMLLACERPASLEVVCDASGFIANFWRAVKHQPDAVAEWADYPVLHVDLGARHAWLMEQRAELNSGLQDADWPGNAKVAGWWLWGQCCWIGSGWCKWEGKAIRSGAGPIPLLSAPGMGIHSLAEDPLSDAPHMLTSMGRVSWEWMHRLSDRLERVRVIHGDWTRCLNHHYGGTNTSVFLDPPYRGYERLYNATPVASAVATWASEHSDLRIALCGHLGDYDLPGWDAVQWKRGNHTYGGSKTTNQECVWYSLACLPAIEGETP